MVIWLFNIILAFTLLSFCNTQDTKWLLERVKTT